MEIVQAPPNLCKLLRETPEIIEKFYVKDKILYIRNVYEDIKVGICNIDTDKKLFGKINFYNIEIRIR